MRFHRTIGRSARIAYIAAAFLVNVSAWALPAGSAPIECYRSCCSSQSQEAPHGGHDMDGHDAMSGQMPGMSHDMTPHGRVPTLIDAIELHATSGTDVEPNSTPHPMWMLERAGWQFMFHGVAFANEIQQTGPRGGDKFFSTNWFMPMAQREVGPGQLTARVMLSLEPATITDRRYPELFQTGETAFGLPIVDGQHPHNLFMEIAAFYDWKLGEKSLVSIYAAPVGDPALGPVAYPHRTSASEDPIAALGHHMQDSTHIADEVVTVGYAYSMFRVEASGFHGREPNENRWNIAAGAIDSWSARLTVSPTRDWTGQFSLGSLHSPEALFPLDDQRRMTASITYNRPIARGNWASSLVWGRTRSLSDGGILNSYLFESTLHFLSHNAVWSRIENVDRTNLLLVGENPLPPGFEEQFLARVQAYKVGYDREFPLIPHFSTAIGGQATFYGMPAFLDSTYGTHPMGYLIFLRFRPEGSMH
jgi:hypothetical protein